jgi:integrase
VDFPRPKTEIARRVPLWAETVIALRTAIAVRPEPKAPADAGCVFLTSRGRRWVRVRETAGRLTPIDALSQRFSSLLKSLAINGRRGFYAIRHSFETIGGESRDQIAVDSIMGHADDSMAAVYRERVSDERLTAVTDCVHRWLFGE